jgi:hypothetical protein
VTAIDEAAIRARATTLAVAFGREEARDLSDLLSLLDAARAERDDVMAKLAAMDSECMLLYRLQLCERDRDALRAALENTHGSAMALLRWVKLGGTWPHELFDWRGFGYDMEQADAALAAVQAKEQA